MIGGDSMSIMGEILQEFLGKFLNCIFEGLTLILIVAVFVCIASFIVSLSGALAGEAGSLYDAIWSVILGGTYCFVISDLQSRLE